jgi:hypothetical protein
MWGERSVMVMGKYGERAKCAVQQRCSIIKYTYCRTSSRLLHQESFCLKFFRATWTVPDIVIMIYGFHNVCVCVCGTVLMSRTWRHADCYKLQNSQICVLLGYHAALSDSSVPTFLENISVPFVVPKRRFRITTQRCVIFQKSVNLIYIAAEVWNHVQNSLRLFSSTITN